MLRFRSISKHIPRAQIARALSTARPTFQAQKSSSQNPESDEFYRADTPESVKTMDKIFSKLIWLVAAGALGKALYEDREVFFPTGKIQIPGTGSNKPSGSSSASGPSSSTPVPPSPPQPAVQKAVVNESLPSAASTLLPTIKTLQCQENNTAVDAQPHAEESEQDVPAPTTVEAPPAPAEPEASEASAPSQPTVFSEADVEALLTMKEAQHSREANELRAAYEQELRTVAAALHSHYEQAFGRALAAQKQESAEECSARIANVLEAQAKQLLKEANERVERQRQESADRYDRTLLARLEYLSAIDAVVQNMGKVLAEQTEYEHTATQVHQFHLAALGLDNVLSRSVAFEPVWERLRSLGTADPVVAAAVASISPRSAAQGVPTLDSLKARFERVEDAARQAAYVPASGSVWGHMVAKFFALVTLKERALVPGDNDHARLARASYYLLTKCDLASAVRELETLSVRPRELCTDFIDVAKERLAVESAMSVLKSRAAVLALQYA